MRRNFLFAAIALLVAGCAHGQIPPTTYVNQLTWGLPVPAAGWAGCTSTQLCDFAISRIAVAAGSTSCPAPAGGNYVLVGTTPVTNPTSYTDTTPAASTNYCYIVQTQQVEPPATQPSTSTPSNTAFVADPAVPGAPTAPAVTPAPGASQAAVLWAPAGPFINPDAWQTARGSGESCASAGMPRDVKVILRKAR